MNSSAQRQKETEERNDERPSGGEKVKVKDNVVLSFLQVLRWMERKVKELRDNWTYLRSAISSVSSFNTLKTILQQENSTKQLQK